MKNFWLAIFTTIIVSGILICVGEVLFDVWIRWQLGFGPIFKLIFAGGFIFIFGLVKATIEEIIRGEK